MAPRRPPAIARLERAANSPGRLACERREPLGSVARCYAGGEDLGARMVSAGWAWAYTQFSANMSTPRGGPQRAALACTRIIVSRRGSGGRYTGLSDSPSTRTRWDRGQIGGIVEPKQNNSHRPMLSPASNRHRPLASQLAQTSFHVHERGLDHQIRLTVSLAALAGTLCFTLLGSPPPELPSRQTVDVPTLKAKS